MSKTLQAVLEDSKHINSGFNKQWDTPTRMVNFMEEVGELAHDILVMEGEKHDHLNARNMGLNIANLLYEIMLISDKYHVDLDASWQEFVDSMPQWVEMRNQPK